MFRITCLTLYKTVFNEKRCGGNGGLRSSEFGVNSPTFAFHYKLQTPNSELAYFPGVLTGFGVGVGVGIGFAP